MLRPIGLLMFSLTLSSPAMAAYWQLTSTKATPASEISQDWSSSITPSGTGAIFHTQLSANSSHPDHGQSFDSKGNWTIPPDALIPGKKLSFQVELSAQKIELGGHWHLGHSVGIYAARHKAGTPPINSGNMQRIVYTEIGTATGAPKTNRSSGEWTVPDGTPDSGLTVRVDGAPGGFNVVYSYSWRANGNPPPSTGNNPGIDGMTGSANGGAVGGAFPAPGSTTDGMPGSKPSANSGGARSPDVSVTHDEPSGNDRISGQEVEIFRNGNDSGVSNGGTEPSFTLSRAAYITSLLTYHYNNGRGVSGGSLQIVSDSGVVHGPWKVEVVNKVYWIAKPNIMLQPGRYRIVDSDPATWSQNSGSNGHGHVIMKGIYGARSAPTATPSATRTAPPQSESSASENLSISGDWECDGGNCKVQQFGNSLTFINGTSRSKGRFSTPNRVIAENWSGIEGRLASYYKGNRMAATEAKERFGLEVSEIRWANGSIWTRIGAEEGGR